MQSVFERLVPDKLNSVFFWQNIENSCGGGLEEYSIFNSQYSIEKIVKVQPGSAR
jgi:hypothetical protein